MYSWSICEFVTFFSKLRRPGETQLRTRRFTINRFKPYLRATSQFVRSLTGRREYWIPIVEDFIVVLGPPPQPFSSGWSARSTERHRCTNWFRHGDEFDVCRARAATCANLSKYWKIWANIEVTAWRIRDNFSIVHRRTIPTANGGRGAPRKR